MKAITPLLIVAVILLLAYLIFKGIAVKHSFGSEGASGASSQQHGKFQSVSWNKIAQGFGKIWTGIFGGGE